MNFFVNEQGLKQGRVDACIFIKSAAGGRPVAIVVCNVDDIVIFAETVAVRDELKKALMAKWTTKDKGEIGNILSLEVIRDRSMRTAVITQSRYLKDAMKELDFAGQRLLRGLSSMTKKPFTYREPELQNDLPGVVHSVTPPYASQPNGRAERAHLTSPLWMGCAP